MNGAVKEVQEAAPLFENLCLFLLLCQLIIDILKLYCLRVIIYPDPAYPILKHPVKGYALLSRSRNFIIFPCCVYNVLYMFFVFRA